MSWPGRTRTDRLRAPRPTRARRLGRDCHASRQYERFRDPDGNRHLERLATLFRDEGVRHEMAVTRRTDERGRAVDELHPVHTDVAHAGLWVARHIDVPGAEIASAILGCPAGNREHRQVDVLPDVRLTVEVLPMHGRRRYRVLETGSYDAPNLAKRSPRWEAERDANPPGRPHRVRKDARVRISADALEEHCAVLARGLRSRPRTHLEVPIDLLADSDEFIGLLETAYELPEVSRAHQEMRTVDRWIASAQVGSETTDAA